jgi:hypothetical protein
MVKCTPSLGQETHLSILTKTKTMKKQAVFFMLVMSTFLFLQNLNAQQRITDKVILLDSTIYEGVIVEQKPAEYVKVWRLREGDTLTVEMDQIDRLVRVSQSPSEQDNGPGTEGPTSRFNNRPFGIMVHRGTGGGDYAFVLMGMSVIYRMTDAFEAGIGGNYHGQTSSNTFPERKFVSVTADMRYRLTQSKSGRFASLISLSTGVAFSLNKDYYDVDRNARMQINNGFYLNPAIALRLNIFENMGLMAELGYQMNSGSLINLDTDSQINTKQYDVFQLKGTIFF